MERLAGAPTVASLAGAVGQQVDDVATVVAAARDAARRRAGAVAHLDHLRDRGVSEARGDPRVGLGR